MHNIKLDDITMTIAIVVHTSWSHTSHELFMPAWSYTSHDMLLLHGHTQAMSCSCLHGHTQAMKCSYFMVAHKLLILVCTLRNSTHIWLIWPVSKMSISNAFIWTVYQPAILWAYFIPPWKGRGISVTQN